MPELTTRDKVKVMMDKHMTQHQIAKALGRNKVTIRDHMIAILGGRAEYDQYMAAGKAAQVIAREFSVDPEIADYMTPLRCAGFETPVMYRQSISREAGWTGRA